MRNDIAISALRKERTKLRDQIVEINLAIEALGGDDSDLERGHRTITSTSPERIAKLPGQKKEYEVGGRR